MKHSNKQLKDTVKSLLKRELFETENKLKFSREKHRNKNEPDAFENMKIFLKHSTH